MKKDYKNKNERKINHELSQRVRERENGRPINGGWLEEPSPVDADIIPVGEEVAELELHYILKQLRISDEQLDVPGKKYINKTYCRHNPQLLSHTNNHAKHKNNPQHCHAQRN